MGERVGVIGLGRMGTALALRLMGQGWSVSGWSRSGVDPDLGLERCDDLTQLAGASDIILLSLFDDAAVNAVLDGLLGCDLSGKIIVDTSTVSPKLLVGRIAQIRAQGASAVDAPISGGPDMVLAGVSGVFVGGTSQDFNRVNPILELFSDKIHHVGDLGSGLAMKVVNNGLLQGIWGALSDVVKIAKRSGLPLERTMTILAQGPAACPMMIARVPKIVGQDKTVGFDVNGVAKDSVVFLRAAEELGLDAPTLKLAQVRTAKGVAAGMGALDVAALITADYDEA